MSEAQPEYGGLLVEVGPTYGYHHVLAQPWPKLDPIHYAQAVNIDEKFLASFPRLPTGNWRVSIYLEAGGDRWKLVTIFPNAIARLVF